MYDAFSDSYDRFVNWPSRLAFEMPFIEAQLHLLAPSNARPLRILDAACGTGMHVLALAQAGYTASGADLSAGMIQRARQNAQAHNLQVEFFTAGFGELAPVTGAGHFDVLLCLGNS